jgi:FAD:protein FMN transferase
VPSWHFGAIGTHWQIDTPSALDEAVKTEVLERIEDYDRAYSRFRDDSLIAGLEKKAGVVEFPADAPALFDLYRLLYEATGGSFSPLVGDTLNHLGYDAHYRLTALPGPADPIPAFSDVLTLDGTTLTTYRPVTIDFGAIGKGYLVDIVATILRESQLDQFTIDASGDIWQQGPEAERIALESPRDPSRALGVALLQNGGLAASATNRRAWGNGLHHIIDGLTGLPTTRTEATFVVAESAAIADGIATALFMTTPEKLSPLFRFEWVMMSSDGLVTSSDGFPGEVF